LRDSHEEIRTLGAQAIGVGMGNVETARSLVATMHLPFPLLIDTERELYLSLELPRASLYGIIGPPIFIAAFRALRRGFRQTGIESDPRQLGGTFVVDDRGEVRHRRPARLAGDHAPWPWIRGALLDVTPNDR
jgi:peroxiredoxin